MSSPNGVNSVPPGVTADVGSRDPSSTTVAGAVTNAYAQMAELASDTIAVEGRAVGDPINLPDRGY